MRLSQVVGAVIRFFDGYLRLIMHIPPPDCSHGLDPGGEIWLGRGRTLCALGPPEPAAALDCVHSSDRDSGLLMRNDDPGFLKLLGG